LGKNHDYNHFPKKERGFCLFLIVLI